MSHSEATSGSLVLDVNGDQLDVRFIDRKGVTKDDFTIVKGPPTPVARPHVLFPPMGSWKYFDQGMDLGTAWKEPAFDDSSWPSGPGPLGYGETWIATTVSYGGNAAAKYPTTYFRRTFQAPIDPAAMDSLRLYANYDDGFVAWLNGQEAARSASMLAGTATYATLATSHEGGAYQAFAIAPALLAPGTNVLAVELHQTSAASTDLVFDAAVDCDAFLPWLGPCAAGNAGLGGAPAELLLLNGSGGGAARSIDLPGLASLTIDVLPPPQSASAPFAIFAMLGTPGPADVFALPLGIGSTCFPLSLLAQAPDLAYVASSFGPDPTLLIPATPAPWTFTLYPGAPPGFVAALQGVILDSAAAFRVTNAVRLNVVPLPGPPALAGLASIRHHVRHRAG